MNYTILARGWSYFLVYVSVWTKFCNHRSREIWTCCYIPSREILCQTIIRDIATIDETSRTNDRPGNISADGKIVFHAQHILV